MESFLGSHSSLAHPSDLRNFSLWDNGWNKVPSFWTCSSGITLKPCTARGTTKCLPLLIFSQDLCWFFVVQSGDFYTEPQKEGWREINLPAGPSKYIFMEVVVPWANLMIHHRHILSWVLNSILCQRVPRSASHCRKIVFSTWAPARSGLEFDEQKSNSLILFVHGSVDLCPIPEFRFFCLFFFTKWSSQCSCTLYGSPSMPLIVLVASLSGFSIYKQFLYHTECVKCLMVLRAWENHEFIHFLNDLFSFPFLS